MSPSVATMALPFRSFMLFCMFLPSCIYLFRAVRLFFKGRTMTLRSVCRDLCCSGRFEDALGLGHLVGGAMRDDEELGTFERCLILHDAVFRNANAVQPGAQRTQPANYHSAFQCSDNPTHQRAENDERTDAWDNKHRRPKQKSPKPAPKGSQFTPDLHAVTDIIKPNDVLFGVIVLAHDGQFLHVESRSLEFSDSRFCLGVGVIDPHYCVTLSHGLLPSFLDQAYADSAEIAV